MLRNPLNSVRPSMASNGVPLLRNEVDSVAQQVMRKEGKEMSKEEWCEEENIKKKENYE